MDHFCGIYRGICTNSNDPDKRGRIKVQVPAVLGQQELGDWAEGCRLPGFGTTAGLKDHVFTDDATVSSTETLKHELLQPLPKPGQLVWVMFEGGDVDSPVWMGVQQ